MKKYIIFIILVKTLLNNLNCFYEELEDKNFEYSMICKNHNCEIHKDIIKFGKVLFKIWFSADLLGSLQYSILQDDPVNYGILSDIISLCYLTINLNKDDLIYHIDDIVNLKEIINNLISHRVIESNKNIMEGFIILKNLLDESINYFNNDLKNNKKLEKFIKIKISME